MNAMDENERKFIIGLEKLTRETGIRIQSDSYEKVDTYLTNAKITSDESGYGFDDTGITWLDPSDNDKWDNGGNWDNYKCTIVK